MYPLSPRQQSLWLAGQLNQDSDAFHEGVAYRVAGPIDHAALVTALGRVVGRQQVLRSTIIVDGELPVQLVGPVPAAAELVEFVERRGAADRDAAAERFARDVLGAGYDLAAGPLLRAAVLSLDDDDHVLVLGLHHLICDGWSIGVLAEELSAAYNAALDGRTADLGELPLQYTDYAVREHDRLGPQELEEQLRYWRGQTVPAPAPLIAGDGAGRTHAFAIPAEVTALLRGLGRAGGTSLFMTLLAGYQVVLAQLADREDLLVGVPVAGRTDLDVGGLIGYFVNLLAFRSDVAGDPTVGELLARVRKSTLGNLGCQDLPFGRLVESVNPVRIPGVHPLAQTAFQYLGEQFAAPLELAGCRSAELEIHGHRSPFLLSLDVFAAGEELHGRLYCRDSVLDSDRVADLAADFVAVLRAMAEDPQQLISALPRTELRLRLAEQPAARVREERGFVPLRAGLEETVGQVLAQVLGVERLGRDDDFFELGGDSLRASRVVARLREFFGIRVPIRELFEHPTVADFAAVISTLTGQTEPEPPALEPAPPGPIVASFAQQRLWFMNELDPTSTAYHMGEAFHLHGHLDFEALRQALHHLTQRHETLRTRLLLENRTLHQHIDPTWTGQLSLTNPTDQQVVDQDAIDDYIATAINQPYDLATGPLFRAGLLQLAPDHHILVLGIHHIICDGWSINILLTELQHLYTNTLHNTPPDLPPLPAQYRDYAHWQNTQLQGPALAPHLDYWRAHIHGAPTTISWRHPAREVSSAAVSEERQVPFSLTADQSAALRAVSRDAGVSLFMTLLAVFQVALARFTGQDDMLIGIPTAGRTALETEGLIGFFVNMLALRADLADDPTFTHLLSNVREHTLTGLTHQDLPFERLVQEVAPDRAGTGFPLVQTVFELLEDEPGSRFGLAGLQVDRVDALPGSRNPDIPLVLSVRSVDGRIEGGVYFDDSVFGQDEMAWFTECLVTLAAALPGHADVPMSQVPLVGPAQIEAVLALGGPDAAPAEPAAPILEEFWRQVARTPDAPAVSDADGTWTFGELGAAVELLAQAVAPAGRRIAVAARRGRRFVAAVIGVLHAGATVVPLEPAEPLPRLRLAVAAAEVDALLLDDSTRTALESLPGKRISIEQALDAPPGRPVTRDHAAESVAAIHFTSGSTGTPKGVLLEYSAFANLLRAHRGTRFTDGPAKAVALTASFSVDASWDQMLWMFAGHHLHVVDEETRRDAAALTDFVQTHRIDVLDVPQSQITIMLELGLLDSGAHQPSVLLLGGEAVPAALWRRLGGRADVTVWNMYGPTENTVDALACRLSDSARPVIGRPLDGTYLRLLDPAGHLVPVGVVGEIHLGGAQLARGYLGRPRLTAERFVPDPYGPVPGRRLYRTGDLGCYLPDGRVEFLGRGDRQVKVRGHRVEAGEIEAAALAHPQVTAAAVVARPLDDGVELAVYLVTIATAQQVRAFLAERLPAHMVPAHFVILPELPLLPSGKVDLRALSEPPDPQPPRDYVALRAGVEETVGQVLAQVLGIERLGRDDDFFELGGHSLRAGQVVARIREMFGVRVPVRELFEHPTAAAFATVISALTGQTAPEPAPIQPAPSGPAPASFAQQRLWFMHELDPASTAYHMGEAFHLYGPLNLDALRQALHHLTQRHETLRTRLLLENRALHQHIDPTWTGQLHLTALADQHTVDDYVADTLNQPYNLATGPLFRADLLQLTPDHHVLVLGIHHIICDGWSINILLTELQHLYTNALHNTPPDLPALPAQYRNYARWQHALFADQTLTPDLDYWRAHIHGAPTTISWRHNPAREQTGEGAVPIDFPILAPEHTARLRAFSRDAGVTLFMTLLAVFQVALVQFTGQDDMLIGIPTAGRTALETEGLIGFFVNMLALRANLTDDPTFTHLLSRTREHTLTGLTYQDLPFERLVSAVNPDRDGDMHPLIQATFQILEEMADYTLSLPGLRAESIDTGLRGSRYDLSFDVFLDEEGLRYWISYDERFLDAEQITSFGELFESLIAGVLADPDRPVSQLGAVRT